MVNESTSNAVTLGYVKEIDRILKKKGFSRKEINESAITNFIYTKGEKEVVIDGWFKNRNFGTFRVIFSVWFNGEEVEIVDCNELQHTNNVQRGTDFVKFYFSKEEFSAYQNKVRKEIFDKISSL